MQGSEGVWDTKLLEDEVLELLRMKNIVFLDPMELLDAKKKGLWSVWKGATQKLTILPSILAILSL